MSRHWYRKQANKPRFYTNTLRIHFTNGGYDDYTWRDLETRSAKKPRMDFFRWYFDEISASYSIHLVDGCAVINRDSIYGFKITVTEQT